MVIQRQRFTCACGHVFDADVVMSAPIEVALASLKAVRCPKCGAGDKKLYLGGGYSDSPALTEPVEVRAAWWKERGEVGISSESIWHAMRGTRRHHASIPYDPDDYRRCRLLLDLIPEWRGDLSLVKTAYPWFAPFIDNWDTMDRLYDEESPKKSFQKLYALMQRLVKESGALGCNE